MTNTESVRANSHTVIAKDDHTIITMTITCLTQPATTLFVSQMEKT